MVLPKMCSANQLLTPTVWPPVVHDICNVQVTMCCGTLMILQTKQQHDTLSHVACLPDADLCPVLLGCRLHNLAHVELNAIDLAWDTVVRFSELQMDQVGSSATSALRQLVAQVSWGACMLYTCYKNQKVRIPFQGGIKGFYARDTIQGCSTQTPF